MGMVPVPGWLCEVGLDQVLEERGLVGFHAGLFNASQLMHSTDFSDHGMH